MMASTNEAIEMKFLSHISLHFIKEDADIEEPEEAGTFSYVVHFVSLFLS